MPQSRSKKEQEATRGSIEETSRRIREVTKLIVKQGREFVTQLEKDSFELRGILPSPLQKRINEDSAKAARIFRSRDIGDTFDIRKTSAGTPKKKPTKPKRGGTPG